jgi:hypothetical protein
VVPDDPPPVPGHTCRMPLFLLDHQHEPQECAAAFAAWAGFASPLRRSHALSSCLVGGHRLWWRVQAASEDEALALLPTFVASRTRATEVREVEIP